MSAQKKSSKEEKQLLVSKAILEVIDKDGLVGVTHSKVARRSGVSRAWIYEYIGKEKTALVEFAADVLGSYFSRAKTELPKNKEQLETQLKDGINFLFDSIEQNPTIIKLYFRFRGTENPIGDVIKKYEKHWLENASKSLMTILKMDKEQAFMVAELALTLRLGFGHRFATASASNDSRARAEKIFSFLHGLIYNYF